MEDRKELDLIRRVESNPGQKDEKGNFIILFISVCFTIFNIWEVLTLSLPPLIERVIFVTFGMILCFLTYPDMLCSHMAKSRSLYSSNKPSSFVIFVTCLATLSPLIILYEIVKASSPISRRISRGACRRSSHTYKGSSP